MSHSTDASSKLSIPKMQKQAQPLQLLLYIKFYTPTKEISNGDRTYCVSCLGCDADFSGHAKQWFEDHPFDGKQEYEELAFQETGIKTLSSQLSIKFKNIIEKYTSPDISSIEIIIFVPFNSVFSILFSAVKYLLNIVDEYSPLAKDLFGKLMGKQLDLSNYENTSISAIYPLSLEDIEDSQTDEYNSNNSPQTIDAQVAAVLCEYTYYLCHFQEKAGIKDFESRDKGKERKKKTKWFGRESSINTRNKDTKNEIDGLTIIPKNWKRVFKELDKEEDFNEEYWENVLDKASSSQPYEGNDPEIKKRQKQGYSTLNWKEDDAAKKDLTAFQKELEDWDCINPEMDGWIGMRYYPVDEGKKAWAKSDSKRLTDILKDDKNGRRRCDKFSRNENKGVLNSWLGICRFSGLGSAIFINEKRKVIMYCTAGSDTGGDTFFNGDWTTTNFLQFLVGLSPQYQQSVTNAKILDEVVTSLNGGYKLFFIGHSLGGGLASNNAIVTKDRHAITFNAAGLNWMRVPISVWKNNKADLFHPIRRRERVHLFVIKGELLDNVQGTLTPLPWKLNNLLYNALPYQTKGYCSTSTRREIETKLNNGLLEKHSMTNFLVPPKQVLSINI